MNLTQTWVILAFVGVLVSVKQLWNVHTDRRYVVSHGYNGRLMVMANGHIRTATGRLIICVANLYVGLLAWAVAPPPALEPPPGHWQIWLLQVSIRVVLIANEAWLVLSTSFDQNDRRRLIRTFTATQFPEPAPTPTPTP